jgi:ATP-dependent Clp protease, protease subunit
MTTEEALALLGLDALGDRVSLKRAYLRQIRHHGPERAPERFMQVRAAYDLLLGLDALPAQLPEPPPLDATSRQDPTREPQPPPNPLAAARAIVAELSRRSELSIPATAIFAAILELYRDGEPAEAARLYQAWLEYLAELLLEARIFQHAPHLWVVARELENVRRAGFDQLTALFARALLGDQERAAGELHALAARSPEAARRARLHVELVAPSLHSLIGFELYGAPQLRDLARLEAEAYKWQRRKHVKPLSWRSLVDAPGEQPSSSSWLSRLWSKKAPREPEQSWVRTCLELLAPSLVLSDDASASRDCLERVWRIDDADSCRERIDFLFRHGTSFTMHRLFLAAELAIDLNAEADPVLAQRDYLAGPGVELRGALAIAWDMAQILAIAQHARCAGVLDAAAAALVAFDALCIIQASYPSWTSFSQQLEATRRFVSLGAQNGWSNPESLLRGPSDTARVLTRRPAWTVATPTISRLLDARVILALGELNNDSVNIVLAQLLYLESRGPEPVLLVMHSPGGLAVAALAITDTLPTLRCPVATFVPFLCSGAAVTIASSGRRGSRYMGKHARLDLRSFYLGSAAPDAEDAKRELATITGAHVDVVTAATGQEQQTVLDDMTAERSFDGEQARRYGLIDHVGTPPQFAQVLHHLRLN